MPIARILKTKYSFPIISIIHSAQWHFSFEGNKQKFIESWVDKTNSPRYKIKPIEEEKELYELSDKIISVTDYMKKFIIKYYQISEGKTEVVHNGIDTTIFHIPEKNEKIALKLKLGFRENEKLVLFSGRLDAPKGLYFLIDAFAAVVKQNDNIRLVIIGEDGGQTRISQYLTHCENIWSKITFTGFLEYDTVFEFYQIADVGIIPSIYDHCPYVALEMIGHNIPLIISNTEGLNEVLSETQSVYLTPLIDDEGNISFDKIEISDAILSLINDEEKASLITRDYPGIMKSRFPAHRMAGEMLDAVKSLFMATSNN